MLINRIVKYVSHSFPNKNRGHLAETFNDKHPAATSYHYRRVPTRDQAIRFTL